MWELLGEEAAPFMAAAGRRYGRAVLAAGDSPTVGDDRESAGCCGWCSDPMASRTSRRLSPALSRIQTVSSCSPT